MSSQKTRCVALLAAAIAVTPPAHSDEATTTNITGTLLWHGGQVTPALGATVAGAIAPNAAGTVSPSGASSAKKPSSLKHVAAQVLGESHPCAAVALMVFDPRAARQNRWEMTLEGSPTPQTAKLVAANAQPAEVSDSLYELAGMPYDPDGRLSVDVKLITSSLEPDTAVTTVSCEVVDRYGTSLQLIEPMVRVTWRRTDGALLGLYEAPKAAVLGRRE